MIRRKISDHRPRLSSFNEAEEETPTKAQELAAEDKENGVHVDPNVEEHEQGDKTDEAEEKRRLELAAQREEAKLKAKYPGLQPKGGSSFLAKKKLQRGHQFFDSGDYNVVKGKKIGLSGAAAGSSKTKPEASKKPEVQEKPFPVTMSELSNSMATADMLISRRMALYRTKSESGADIEGPGTRRGMRSGSMFVSSPSALNATFPGNNSKAGARRGSAFPSMQSSGYDVIIPPSADQLQNRRQSMIPAIPSKLAHD